MAFKFISFFAILAVASCGVAPVVYEQPAYTTYSHAAPVVHHAPVVKTVAPAVVAQPAYIKTAYVAPQVVTKIAQPVVTKVAEDYDHNPQYSFAYDVQDGLTGDSKSQHESRNGDVVEGHYSLVDSDGFKRTVHYKADPINGFNAQVQREPLTHKVVAQPTIVKTVQPAIVKTVQPAYVKTVQPAVIAHQAPVVHAAPAYYHH
ncbi:larval cuticle protein A2B-like isoform X1 [Chironomus tepperi]|uniref:larval cuticle protein A2B-like isoform X1 n=1 Tax=Chironomus tepperi TaxID=113505 RepID=UPI00391F2127